MISPEAYLTWRAPREGRSNPEDLSNPVWQWLIESKLSAYQGNAQMGGPSSFPRNPAWCFQRFGQTTTRLRDGRRVLVAGEHEDHYDPDFYIYNDVVVRAPGRRAVIFGYPRAVFPPTDFHSATLVRGRIVLVGNLGYPEARRPGFTQVLALDTASFAVASVATSGEGPGWISRHRARLAGDGRAIVVRGGQVSVGDGGLVENIDDWALELEGWQWRRLTRRPWQIHELGRQDGRHNELWHVSSLVAYGQLPNMASMMTYHHEALVAAWGGEPDVSLAAQLYTPGLPHAVMPPLDHRTHRVRIRGVVVRFVEGLHAVRVVVQGVLPEATVQALVSELADKLSRLERTPYVVKRQR